MNPSIPLPSVGRATGVVQMLSDTLLQELGTIRDVVFYLESLTAKLTEDQPWQSEGENGLQCDFVSNDINRNQYRCSNLSSKRISLSK